MQELSECVGAALWNRWREDRGWADEAFAIKAGEEIVRAREERCEAEGEVVGRVAWVFEDFAGNLEFAMPNGDEYALLVELGDQFGY